MTNIIKNISNKSNSVKVNKQVLEVMQMNRKDRRKIAKQNGIKNIPSIKNVIVTQLKEENKVVESL